VLPGHCSQGRGSPGSQKKIPWGCPGEPRTSPLCVGNGPQSWGATSEVGESLTCSKSKEGGTEQDPQLPQPLLPGEHQHPGAATTPAAVRGAHCDEWDYKYNWTDNKALIRLLRL